MAFPFNQVALPPVPNPHWVRVVNPEGLAPTRGELILILEKNML